MLKPTSEHRIPNNQVVVAPPFAHEKVVELDKLDISNEIAVTYSRAKGILRQLEDNIAENPTAVVSAVNSLTAQLSQMIKMQERVTNLNKIKKIEDILITLLQKQPKEFRETFLEEYEAALKELE